MSGLEKANSYIQKHFSLSREVATPESQACRDRLNLTFRIWPFFYFKYWFSSPLEQQIDDLIESESLDNFKDRLLELIQLHYISGIMSLSVKELWRDNIFQSHFSDMKYGAYAVAISEGDTPSEIIDSALKEMLYHDITYSWSRNAPFGNIVSYYSAKSLLYLINRKLNKSTTNNL